MATAKFSWIYSTSYGAGAEYPAVTVQNYDLSALWTFLAIQFLLILAILMRILWEKLDVLCRRKIDDGVVEKLKPSLQHESFEIFDEEEEREPTLAEIGRMVHEITDDEPEPRFQNDTLTREEFAEKMLDKS
jgi:hypothetical protein